MSQTSTFAWIRFLRLPAVLTVPGDVLVGAALMSQSLPVREIFSVSFAYLFGMALNDLHDLEEDKRTRPTRPLSSEHISFFHAQTLCGGLAVASLLTYPDPKQLLLILLIILYTTMKDRSLVGGALVMASCRCMVLVMGAGFLIDYSELARLSVLWGALIFMITMFADQENESKTSLVKDAYIPTTLWIGAPIVALFMGIFDILLLIPWGLIVYLAVKNFRLIKQQGEMTPRNTGRWLSMLIPLQSTFLIAFERPMQGLFLLLALPLLNWSVRKIQIS